MSTDDMGSTFIKYLLPYLPLIITIIGWGVANSAANKREIRKERKVEVDACCKLAAEILTKARSYYTKSPQHEDSVRLGREIVFELHRLIQRVERLEKLCPLIQVVGTASELHETATGGQFEENERPILPHDHPILMTLEYWTHQFIDRLEDGFLQSHR